MAKNKKLIILSPAKRDIKNAYEWYEQKTTGLGGAFLKRIDDCLAAIKRSPNAFQPVAGDARRAIVKKFPYVVFYRIEGDVIFVYSVFHTSQNPKKWMDRLAE